MAHFLKRTEELLELLLFLLQLDSSNELSDRMIVTMSKEDLRSGLTSETFCVDSANASRLLDDVCPKHLRHVRSDVIVVASLSVTFFIVVIALSVVIYAFNDRLKRKYDVLAERWKIPVRTYHQVGTFFKKRVIPASFSFNFIFSNNHYNFTTFKCPSRIRCWDSNPRPELKLLAKIRWVQRKLYLILE